MPLLRKAGGGSDSYGHVWKTDRSVVDVPDEQAADLLAIADAGFTVVTAPDDEDDDLSEPAPPAEHPVTEPAPAAEHPVETLRPRKTAKAKAPPKAPEE